MIRALVALLTALFAFGCAPSYLRESHGPHAVIVQDGVPICSSFAVGPHDVLTAAHCVRNRDAEFGLVSKELWETTSDGAAEFEIAFVDEARDLALLRTPYTFRDFLNVRQPQTGERVSVTSAFGAWQTSRGFVKPGYGFFRDTDVTIKHGWSGSPVIGADGKAIGVVVRCYGQYIAGTHFCNESDMQFSVLP